MGWQGTERIQYGFNLRLKDQLGCETRGKKEQIYEGRKNVLDMDPVEFEVTRGPQNRSVNG